MARPTTNWRLVALKVNDVAGAVHPLRKAVELIPADQPDHWDAVVKLTEIYLAYSKGEKQLMDEVEKYTKELLKRDPNSFDGHRLIGDLDYFRATEAFKAKHPDEGRALLDTAIEEYAKADSTKPGQVLVSMQLARALAAKGDFPAAEARYRISLQRTRPFNTRTPSCTASTCSRTSARKPSSF